MTKLNHEEPIMSRRHPGRYSAKHPADISIDPAVEAAVSANLTHGEIACVSAFDIADRLSVTPMDIGIAIDLHEGRIVGCQLGLFGYGQHKKILDAPKKVDPAVIAAIRSASTQERLSCRTAWQLADTHAMARLEIARICESVGIRINKCQLGAFK
jgi:hypothetical protein